METLSQKEKKEEEMTWFGFCQASGQMADVSTCTCVGGGEESIACPFVGSESHSRVH